MATVMPESTTVVSLPQMVDLALNSPEVGIVNFTVLHSLLHVIVNQLELSDTNVEFRGSDSDRLQSYISTAKPGPLLTLTEYTVGDPPVIKRGKKGGKRKSIAPEKGKKDEEHKEKTKKKGSVESESSGSTVVVVESSKGSIAPQFTVAVTKNHFERLETDISRLDKKVRELTELPANSALIQALRSDSTESTPILDMYQILNLTKRLDATELAMEKIASMVEEKGKQGLLTIDEDSESRSSDHPPWHEIMERIERIEMERTLQAAPPPPPTEGEAQEAAEEAEEMPPPKVILDMQTELEALKERVEAFNQPLADLEEIKIRLEPAPGGEYSEALPQDVRLNQIEIRFGDLVEQMNSLDNVYNRQAKTLQDRIGDLEKEFNEIIEKIRLGLPAGDAGMEGQSMSEMFTMLTRLQDDVNNMSETAQKLTEERDEKQHAFDVILEQVELLKTVKADREDLEDALADKADACQINRKVSMEQFDAVCFDMSKSIEEALRKLTDQETLWSQALDEIQKDVGNKLDKMELSPLKDFINKKLRHLQEKLKTLAAMKRETEAAGTRSKFLKNVNCISCDKDVIMRKEVDSSLYPKPYALPPTRNMGPYLAYELDQLRKQQKCLPHSKNLNAFENAMQSARSAKSPDHICNRYCGGSHTVTTPQQRVTRVGHFLEQWGPEIGLVNETNIRGTDGQMYKGRDEKALKHLSVDKASAGLVEQPVPSTPTTPAPSTTGGGITGKPATDVSVAVHKSKTPSTVSARKSAHDTPPEAEKLQSGTEITTEAPPPPPEPQPPGDAVTSPTGIASPKKSGSRSSAKGSKSSIPKSSSKQSAEKIETVPEESEPQPPPSEE